MKRGHEGGTDVLPLPMKVPWLGSHLGHIFLLLVENIERILIIGFCEKLAYLLKSIRNPGMSISWKFSSDRVQVPPSAPLIGLQA